MTVRADVSSADIDAALQAVLQSTAFARSERARDLLAYLVTQERQGQGDRLKAFTIGQDVFDRDDSFDPQSDAIVRVQAGRLRELLDTYYASEGQSDPVLLRVPVGSYVPVYQSRSILQQDVAALQRHEPNELWPSDGDVNVSPDIPVSPFIVRNIHRFWIVLAAILLLTLLILSLTWVQFRAVTSNSSDTLRSTVEPIQTVVSPFRLPSVSVVESGVARDGVVSDALQALRRDISRFSTIRLAADSQVPVAPDFRMMVHVINEDTVTLEVADTYNGDIIWAGMIDADTAAPDVPANADVLTLLLEADGLMFSAMAERQAMSTLMQCLRRTQSYFRALDAETHAAALQCHQSIAQNADPHPLVQADLASLIVDGIEHGFDIGGLSIGTALNLAGQSVAVDPSSAYARRALAVSLFADGQEAAALEEMITAHELNPANLGIGASYGFALLQTGQFSRAAAILARVTSASDNPLPWWNQMLFLSAAALEDDVLMGRAARQFTSYEQPAEMAMRIIGADLSADTDEVERLILKLNEDPALRLANPRQYFAETLPTEQVDRLLEILARSGY